MPTIIDKRLNYRKRTGDIYYVSVERLLSEVERLYLSHETEALENIQILFAVSYAYLTVNERENISKEILKRALSDNRLLGLQLVSAQLLCDSRNHKSGLAKNIISEIDAVSTPYSKGFFPSDKAIAFGIGEEGAILAPSQEFFGTVGGEEYSKLSESEDIDAYNDTLEGKLYDGPEGRGFALSTPGTSSLLARHRLRASSLGVEARAGSERNALVVQAVYDFNFFLLATAVGTGIGGPAGTVAGGVVGLVGWGISQAFLSPVLDDMKYGHLVEPATNDSDAAEAQPNGGTAGTGTSGADTTGTSTSGEDTTGTSTSGEDTTGTGTSGEDTTDTGTSGEDTTDTGAAEKKPNKPDDQGKVVNDGGGGEGIPDANVGDIRHVRSGEFVTRNTDNLMQAISADGLSNLLRDDSSAKLYADFQRYEQERSQAINDVINRPSIPVNRQALKQRLEDQRRLP